MTGPARRVGVIGLGTISKYYLHAVEELPGWELVAVCDVNVAALAPYAGTVRCFADHLEMVGKTDLDAVVVTVPNDVHATVCRGALHAGIPVCVEKPLALSLAEGRELDLLSHNAGVPLFTAFHRRYNDNVGRLHDEIARRGHITALTMRYLERIEEHIGADNWYLDPRRCGGGCVADNGPNAFDLVRMFLGEAEVVNAAVERDRHGTDRRAVIELRSARGVPATVELDWSHPGEIKDVNIRFADGTRCRADMLAGHTGFKSSLWHEYTGILTDFAAAIAAGTTGHDGGIAAMELVAETYRIERAGMPMEETT